MGERLLRTQEAGGSNPPISTSLLKWGDIPPFFVLKPKGVFWFSVKSAPGFSTLIFDLFFQLTGGVPDCSIKTPSQQQAGYTVDNALSTGR